MKRRYVLRVEQPGSLLSTIVELALDEQQLDGLAALFTAWAALMPDGEEREALMNAIASIDSLSPEAAQ